MNFRLTPFFVGALALVLGGCATYTETVKDAVTARRSGNSQAAAMEAAKLAQKHADDRDTVVYNLEAASAYRTLGLNQIPPPPPPPTTSVPAVGAPVPPSPAAAPFDEWKQAPYRESLRYLAVADDKIDEYEERAKHSISAGATMIVTNPAMVPYRGQAYDKVMASTYAALNYLALGELEKARASFNKAYGRQADAVEENKKRIEKDQEKITAAKEGKVADENGKAAKSQVDISKSQNDQRSKDAMTEINRSLDARIQAYGDYVNPFTVFADALFMTACAADRQEQERGAKQFLRVASMVPQNEYLKQDAALAEEVAAGRAKMPKTTYVIFESGEAPHREELIIPIPLFLLTEKEPLYTQLPLYRLAFNDQCNQSATISADGKQLTTSVVCNMDSVIARDYKNGLGTMWLDAFLCASTKALLQHELNKQAAKNGGNTALFVGLIGAITNVATTRADTRSWSSLPKVFSYARVETPASGALTITTPDSVTRTITVPDATVSVVYVKQVRPGTELLVDSFKLL